MYESLENFNEGDRVVNTDLEWLDDDYLLSLVERYGIIRTVNTLVRAQRKWTSQ